MKTQKQMIVTSLIVGILTFASVTAQAAPKASQQIAPQSIAKEDTSSSLELSHRSEKKIGAYLGILGDPHPTVLGMNAAYNLFDFMRVSVGMGKVSVTTMTLNNSGFATEEKSITTLGIASKFLVPGWNVTPSIGLGYSHVFLSDGLSLDNTDYKANNIYTSLGVDWQSQGGFNLGAGANVSINGAAPFAPYINLGYFFM